MADFDLLTANLAVTDESYVIAVTKSRSDRWLPVG